MVRIVLIELMFLALPCASQVQPMNYSLHVGDRWEFGDGAHIQILSDTLFPSGKSYFRCFDNSVYDTIYRRIEGNRVYAVSWLMGPDEFVEYDFGANPGDTVASIVDTSSINGFRWLVIAWPAEEINVLGVNRKAIVFHSDYMGDNSHWDYITDTLGMAFRLKSCRCGHPVTFEELTGAYVDGQAYGSVTGVQNPPRAMPAKFELNQNYPNPFNPVTTIRYSLPTEEHVTLTVYNTLGEAVAELVDEQQGAGFRSVAFDGGRLPSGMYICKIRAGAFTDQKKLLLIR